MLTKKNIVLNGIDGQDKRGVLSLTCNGRTITGRVRLYNFSSQPKGIVTLGLYSEGRVIKAGMIYLGEMLYSLVVDGETLPSVFSCAVINFVEGQPHPILYGCSEGQAEQEDLQAVVSALGGAKTSQEVEKILDEHDIDFDDEVKQDIEKELDKYITNDDKTLCESVCQNNNDCNSCKYKKFYEENHASEIMALQEEKKESFYQEMRGQLDSLFKNNQSEEYLESLIPNSKWVKISTDEAGEYFVLGIIKDKGEVKYICYGVPGVYQTNPPKELSGYPVWFPLDQEKNESFGYWLSYQDAESGESVKAVVV